MKKHVDWQRRIKMNWDKRKESEKWAREKADEFTKLDTDLTFAEWCYRQGKADGIREFAEEYETSISGRCKYSPKHCQKDTACILCYANKYIEQLKEKNDGE